MKSLLANAAKYLYALPFIVFGIFHFMMADGMAGIVPGWLPGGVVWVYLTGLGLIAGGLGLVLNKYGYYSALILAFLLLSFVLFVHLPGVIDGNQSSMPNLLKDLAMLGGALHYASHHA